MNQSPQLLKPVGKTAYATQENSRVNLMNGERPGTVMVEMQRALSNMQEHSNQMPNKKQSTVMSTAGK